MYLLVKDSEALEAWIVLSLELWQQQSRIPHQDAPRSQETQGELSLSPTPCLTSLWSCQEGCQFFHLADYCIDLKREGFNAVGCDMDC